VSATAAVRDRVLVVTEHWGSEVDEAAAATRLLAGALARTSDVEIVRLMASGPERADADESVFRLHDVGLVGARPRTAAIVRAALASHDGGSTVPRGLDRILSEFEGEAPGAATLIAERRPAALLLAGHLQPYDLSVLGERGPDRATRVVFCPMLSDLRRLDDDRVRRLLGLADAIGALHPGEARAIAQAVPERADAIVPIDLALNLNRGATEQGLFGVGWFGRFVVAIRRFPADGPRFARSLTHEMLRSSLQQISVAEVDGTRWRITDADNTVELPVNPTRINLWRLMAHGLATVDLRPPGPFGRESVESMLLGTPVIVPDDSAAMEHVAAAGGGLWYRNPGELLDGVRTVVGDGVLRAQLGEQAQRYATAHHGDMADFVTRTNVLVRGAGANRPDLEHAGS
jgi:hypothetical protein